MPSRLSGKNLKPKFNYLGIKISRLTLFRIYIIIFFSAFHVVYAQKKVKVDEKIRVIEYHVLSKLENSGFYRKNQELPKILLEAAVNNELSTYQIDYHEGAAILISPEALSRKLRKVNEPGLIEKYQPEEVSLIGIDVTQGYKDDQIYRQYNFLNLYVPYYHSPTTTNVYIASFRFNDVLELLDNKGVLWYTETYALSRGIFSNHGGNSLGKTGWFKQVLEDIKLGHLNVTFNDGVNISGYQALDGYAVDIRLTESFDGRHFSLDSIELYKAQSGSEQNQNLFICSVAFKDYQNYLSGPKSNSISMMSEALLNNILISPSEIWRNRFENFYDANFMDNEIISHDGTFQDSDRIDPYSTGMKLSPQKAERKKITNKRYTVRQIEFSDLSMAGKEQLNGMLQTILESAFKGSLDIYENDSLLTTISPNEFKSCFNSSASDRHNQKQIEWVYELTFDIDGGKRSYKPLGLGVMNASKLFGYFAFEDLQPLLSQEQLNTFQNRAFKGFVRSCSHIAIE